MLTVLARKSCSACQYHVYNCTFLAVSGPAQVSFVGTAALLKSTRAPMLGVLQFATDHLAA